MTLPLLIAAFIIYGAAFRRYNFLSPGHTYAVLSLLTFFSFYILVDLQLTPGSGSILSASWKFRTASSLASYSDVVSFILFFCVIFGIFAEFVSSAIVGRNLTSAVGNLESLSSEAGLILRRPIVRLSLSALYIFLLACLAAHYLAGAMDAVFSPHPYRFAKSAEWIGLENPLGRVIHGTPDLIQYLCICLATLHLRAGQYHFAFLAGVVAIYCGTLEFFLSSRSQVLALALIALLSLVYLKGKTRIAIVVVCSFLALMLYEVALTGREQREISYDVMVSALFESALNPGNLVWQIGVMTFIGGTKAAYSLGRPLDLPIEYQLLSSLSPFPSSIDGFDQNWRSYYVPIEGDQWRPLGGLGELVLFSPWIVLLFVLVMFSCFVIIGVTIRRSPGLLSIGLFGATLLPIVKFGDYALRGHTRTIVLAAIACIVIDIVKSRNFRVRFSPNQYNFKVSDSSR